MKSDAELAKDDCTSEKTIEVKVDDANDGVLKPKYALGYVLAPSTVSLITLVGADDDGKTPEGWALSPHSCWHKLRHIFRPIQLASLVLSVFLWLVGAVHAFNQFLDIFIGYTILHTARPHDIAFSTTSVAAVMRTGAVGGAVMHAAIMWPVICFVLLSFAGAPKPTPEEISELRARASGPIVKMSTKELWVVRAIGALTSIAWAAAAGAVGAMILKATKVRPEPMGLDHSALASVVGALVLLAPRFCMMAVCKEFVERKKQEIRVMDAASRAETIV